MTPSDHPVVCVTLIVWYCSISWPAVVAAGPDPADDCALCVAHRQSRQGEQLCRMLCKQAQAGAGLQESTALTAPPMLKPTQPTAGPIQHEWSRCQQAPGDEI